MHGVESTLPPSPARAPPCLQARSVGDSTFVYGHVMIDKAQVEMAAVDDLKRCGEASGYLLCYFHFLQEWERFIRSAESGVTSKEMQNAAMVSLASLARLKEPTIFKLEVRHRVGGAGEGSTEGVQVVKAARKGGARAATQSGTRHSRITIQTTPNASPSIHPPALPCRWISFTGGAASRATWRWRRR